MKGWQNGTIKPVSDLQIPLLDRGVQYGEGLYETMLVRDGEVPLLDRHLARLERSCERIDLPAPERDHMTSAIEETMEANQTETDEDQLILKLLLTGGEGKGLYRKQPPEPRFFLIPRPYPADAVETWKSNGAICRFVSDRGLTGTNLGKLKSTSRLGASLILKQVRDDGGDTFREGLLVNDDHHLLQGSRTNVFVYLNQTWYTPPVSEGILPGVTRQLLLDEADQRDVTDRVLFTREVLKADHMVVTNAVTGPIPVRELVAPSLLCFERDPVVFPQPAMNVLDDIWNQAVSL